MENDLLLNEIIDGLNEYIQEMLEDELNEYWCFYRMDEEDKYYGWGQN